jgi:hypothetical protein
MVIMWIIYVGLCALVGYLGRDRKLGPWGHVLISLLFTPLIGIITVLASDKRLPT